MSSFIKNISRCILRLAFKLVLAVCLAVILVIIIVFFFPEKIVETAVPYVLPGLECRAGSINWLANGLRLYDLHISFRGSTADLERVSLTWQTTSNAPAVFLLALREGTVSLSIPDPVQTDTPDPVKEKSPTQWWNSFQSPITLSVFATNIAFKTDIAQLKRPVSGNISFDCRLSSTALLNRVSGSCSGILPSPAAVTFSITQHSNRFDIACQNTAINLPLLVGQYKPFLPVPVSCSRGQADAAFRSRVIFSTGAPILTNTRLTASVNALDAKLPGFGLNAKHGSGNLLLFSTQAVHLHTNHSDLVKYLLESFEGTGDLAVQSFTARNIPVTNSTVQARIFSNALHLVSSELYAFGGRVRLSGRLARKKVKDVQAWRFRYDLDLSVTNLDAGSVCDTFNLHENRLEGRFHGSISTYIFNRWVKMLSGTLDSDGNGTFYFPESEKYVKNMDPSMQKQVVSIMAERLKAYPYQVCHIDLDYDSLKKSTYITFGFYSDYDNSSYLFPIVIHMSWLDALKLVHQFQ